MFLKVFIAVIVIGLLAGGGYFYMQSRGESTTKETTETTPTPQASEATPTPDEVDKKEFKIEIQNGSGIEGEAGRAKELLEGDDFEITGTANADNYDYEETVIQASSDVSDEWIDELIATLEKKYTVQTRIDDLDGSDSDVVVIVGKFDDSGESMVTEEEEEESTDPTPTPEESTEDPTNTPSPSPSPTSTQ